MTSFTMDYYPFGLEMEGRTWKDSVSYRYGFNGKEKDDKNDWGNVAYDYGDRMYDPRIGRWWSTDTYSSKYPSLASYVLAANSPIIILDMDGNDIINGHEVTDAEYYQVEQAIKLIEKHHPELYQRLHKDTKIKIIVRVVSVADATVTNSNPDVGKPGVIVMDNTKTTQSYGARTRGAVLFHRGAEVLAVKNDDGTLKLDASGNAIYNATRFNTPKEQEDLRQEGIDPAENNNRAVLTEAEAQSGYIEIVGNEINILLNPAPVNKKSKEVNDAMAWGKKAAHELGHAEIFIYNLISTAYWPDQPDGEKYHEGHQTGNPSGNNAFRRENEFQENFKANKKAEKNKK